MYELGFESAIEWIGERISEEHDIQVEFVNDKYLKPVDEDIGAFLFRSVNELLINIVKHAKAQKVKITILKRDDFIRIAVVDDGIGFDISAMNDQTWLSSKFGLFSIRERIEGINGSITISSEPGHGTCVEMAVPIKKERISYER